MITEIERTKEEEKAVQSIIKAYLENKNQIWVTDCYALSEYFLKIYNQHPNSIKHEIVVVEE